MEQIKTKKKFISTTVVLVTLILIIGACSTEKNTFVNRTYHSTTARYNGLFNAREMIRLGLEEYRETAREDYTHILPVDLLPNEEDVTDFYPIIDTAIVKCQKVIQQHSMPTASKPSQKKSEHAKWIDQNWLMIARAQYIRRDYQAALTSYTYIRKFYEDKPSSYSGQLGEVRSHIQLGSLSEARRSLQKLEQKMSLINSKKDKDDEVKKPKKRKKKLKNVKRSSSSKEDEPAPLPKNFEFELAQTKGILALAEDNKAAATNFLKIALKKAKKKEDKARLNFILGQLHQESGDPSARMYYTEAIKKNAPFEMSFNAKINRAVVSDLADDEMVKELTKLAKEVRYLEFRDQIYFAMSKIELGRNDRDMAKKDLSKSVFYSLNNNLQKGISYEKLGDLTFEEKNYVFAQRYYDSSAQVIPETYPNYDIIKNKANKLKRLVQDIEVITYEDSVQRIALMSEKDQEKFARDVIKQLKKEDQERREREALRAEQLRKLQQTYDAQNQKTGSKFYFTNQKAMQKGVEDFRNVWGQRENEDYWRLSNKPSRISMEIAIEAAQNDSIPSDSLIITETRDVSQIALDSLTVEDLLRNIPLTDSAMAQSNLNLINALYSSGMIYKEQLEELMLATEQLQRIIDKDVENEHNVMAAFQLYKMNENTASAGTYKSYILNNYPNSDYANYLRDPDYFVKKKERDALALKDYLRSVTHFEQGLFYPVILKADKVINEEEDNPFRKEYFLLKAMAMGQVNPDKESLLPVLEQIIEEYPETEAANRAKEYKELINNGIPPFEEFEQAEADIFSFDSKNYYVIIELKENQEPMKTANNVSDFNNIYFSRLKLSSKEQIYDKETDLVVIQEFISSMEAKNYIKDFKNAKRYVSDLKGNEIMLISRENFKTLLQGKKLTEYRKFYEKHIE